MNFNSPVSFFVGEGTNDWRMYGKYSLQRWGEISPTYISRLPPSVSSLWVRDVLRTDWGKKLVNKTNAELERRAQETGIDAVLVTNSEVGITTALNDGRLIINFMIMECLSYQPDMFETLVYYEKHPKLSGSVSSSKAKSRVRRTRRKSPEETTSDTGSVDGSGSEGQIGKKRNLRNLRSMRRKRRKGGSETENVHIITDSESESDSSSSDSETFVSSSSLAACSR
jgi:hypothetical protein